MYAILGSTGNTGSVVARRLLDKSKRVRVVGRDNKKLAPFVSRFRPPATHAEEIVFTGETSLVSGNTFIAIPLVPRLGGACARY
jgi:uncharacterized protein YbjT (DUF2867 family)